MQSTDSLTSLSSKIINTATPPPVEDLHLLETSSDLADYRLDEATTEEGEEAANQPCFMGICLPRNILNLFPRRELGKPYVAIDLDTEIAAETAASGSVLADDSASLCSSSSPMVVVDETDHVMVRVKARGGGGGGADEIDGGEGEATITNPDQEPMTKLCLNCSQTTTTATKTSTANATKTSSSSSSNSSNLVITTDRSGGGGTADGTATTPSKLSKHHKKLIMLRGNVTDSKRIKGGTLSLASADGGGVSEGDRELIAILVNVQRCANPVLMKQAKLNLLELKQKHAEHFQDLCLYSEVLKAIGRNTYRQSARRFLQELFLDIEFEQLLGEMKEQLRISERRPKEATGATAAGSILLSVRSGPGRDTTSYGSMIHSVELRNGRRECEKIDEEDFGVTKGIRKSLPEPIVSPSRSHVSESGASGDSETSTANGCSGGGGGMVTVGSLGKGFSRVQLSCSVNKFPVKRDRANSLNAPTTAKDY